MPETFRRTPMLTAAEVAEWLAIDRGRVYRMHKSGQLEGLRFAGALRFDPRAVAALIDGRPADRRD